MKPLAGRVAIVTGGSRGIGRGCAIELGAAGATVYLTGRTLREICRAPQVQPPAELAEALATLGQTEGGIHARGGGGG